MRDLIRNRSETGRRLAACVLRHDPRRKLAETRERMGSLQVRLERATERLMRELVAHLHATEARLHALSPLQVLIVAMRWCRTPTAH